MQNLCGVCEETYTDQRKCTHCGASFEEQWKKRFDMKTTVELLDGRKVTVSTVNLILWHVGGWFETMIFEEREEKDRFFGFQERYTTKAEATKRHKEIVEKLPETPEEFLYE